MKRYAIPAVGGILVFGVVSGFAASLDLSSTKLSSGNDTVDKCNASAAVSYTTAFDALLNAYEVATAPVTSGAGCAGLAYKVTLTGTDGAGATTVLAESPGALAADGSADPAFTDIKAQDVTGVSVVITG